MFDILLSLSFCIYIYINIYPHGPFDIEIPYFLFARSYFSNAILILNRSIALPLSMDVVLTFSISPFQLSIFLLKIMIEFVHSCH